jgi:hypothetical protein
MHQARAYVKFLLNRASSSMHAALWYSILPNSPLACPLSEAPVFPCGYLIFSEVDLGRQHQRQLKWVLYQLQHKILEKVAQMQAEKKFKDAGYSVPKNNSGDPRFEGELSQSGVQDMFGKLEEVHHVQCLALGNKQHSP